MTKKSYGMKLFLILIVISWATARIVPADDIKPLSTENKNNIQPAVSYVSFVKHVVPKGVPSSMLSTKAIASYPINKNLIKAVVPTSHYLPSEGKRVPMNDRAPQIFHPPQLPQEHHTSKRPHSNTYRPIYPTGYAAPVYVYSKVPVFPERASTSQGNKANPMVIGVQHPAYVRKFVQFASPYPKLVTKTLGYAPRLTYITHSYQRV